MGPKKENPLCIYSYSSPERGDKEHLASTINKEKESTSDEGGRM